MHWQLLITQVQNKKFIYFSESEVIPQIQKRIKGSIKQFMKKGKRKKGATEYEKNFGNIDIDGAFIYIL